MNSSGGIGLIGGFPKSTKNAVTTVQNKFSYQRDQSPKKPSAGQTSSNGNAAMSNSTQHLAAAGH